MLRATITLGGKRLAAIAALVGACLFVLVGPASADEAQKLSITGPAAVDEGGQATFTIKLTEGEDADAEVTVTAGPDEGTEASDLTARSAKVTVPEGDTGVTFTVDVAGDSISEPAETFTVRLSEPARATIDVGAATTTITDKSDLPSVSAISDATVLEGDSGTTATSIRVTLSAVSERVVTVPWSTAPGTANADDFVAASGTLTIPAGSPHGDITVQVKGDTIFEPDERFSVVITAPTNATLGTDNIGEVTIDDDDSALTPTVPDAEVEEGNAGDVFLVFKVTLGGPRPETRFNYRTVALSANATDYDEVGNAAMPPFPAGSGSTTHDVAIKIKVDTVDELDETFRLEILDPSKPLTDPTAVVASAIGTIKNDDNNSVLTINDASADEPTSGEGALTFTVSLSAASARTVTVNWGTSNGTAAAGSDYTAASGSLTFAPGETSKPVTVPILADAFNEENETLTVDLSGESGAGVGDRQGLGTIVDKNAPPSLSVSDVVTQEGKGAAFVVTLAGNTLRTVTVRFNTTEGTAKAGTDFLARVGTLTFQPGEKTKEIEVTIVDDSAAEAAEDFFLTIGDAQNATVTKTNGRATIEANDQAGTAQTPTAPRPTTPTVPKAPVAVKAPRMVLGPRTVKVGANGVAKMLVTCQAASPITCAGTVELQRVAKPLLKVGKKTFSVKKGKKAYASIKLSARSLGLLRKSGSMRVRVIVVYKKTVGTGKAVPGIVTLTATKVKAKPKTTAAKPKSAAKPPPTKVIVDP